MVAQRRQEAHQVLSPVDGGLMHAGEIEVGGGVDHRVAKRRRPRQPLGERRVDQAVLSQPGPLEPDIRRRDYISAYISVPYSRESGEPSAAGDVDMTRQEFDALDVEERAYKASLTADAQEMTQYLLDVIGARSLAVGLGMADARPLYQWRDGRTPPRRVEVNDRLRALYRATRMVAESYGANAASVFVRSANPQLDDRSVLTVLADEPDGEARIVAAARTLLEG